MRYFIHLLTLVVSGVVLCYAGSDKTSARTLQPVSLLKEILRNGQQYRTFEYDSLNRLISVKAYNYDYGNETYSYDSLGRLAKRLYGGFEETYRYGENGNLISMTKYYKTTDKTWSETYRRDTQGTLLGATTLYNGDTSGYVRYARDTRGNVINRSEYDMSGMLNYQDSCTFDTFPNPVQLLFPFENGIQRNIVNYYYYAIIMSSPPIRYSSTFSYNSARLPIREIRVSSYDTITFDYQYEPFSKYTEIDTRAHQPETISISGFATRSGFLVSFPMEAGGLVNITLCDFSGRRTAILYGPATLPSGSRKVILTIGKNGFSGGALMVVKMGAATKAFKISMLR